MTIYEELWSYHEYPTSWYAMIPSGIKIITGYSYFEYNFNYSEKNILTLIADGIDSAKGTVPKETY